MVCSVDYFKGHSKIAGTCRFKSRLPKGKLLHSALSTQHSALSTRHSALGTRCSVLGARCSVLGAWCFKTAGTRPRPAPYFLSKPTKS